MGICREEERGGIVKGLEAFDEVRRAIVVAAHPDDLECCCGGVVTIVISRAIMYQGSSAKGYQRSSARVYQGSSRIVGESVPA